jgi:hypothetical protein
VANEIALTNDELAALAALDGTHAGSRMRVAIRTRLTELHLVERRDERSTLANCGGHPAGSGGGEGYTPPLGR